MKRVFYLLLIILFFLITHVQAQHFEFEKSNNGNKVEKLVVRDKVHSGLEN